MINRLVSVIAMTMVVSTGFTANVYAAAADVVCDKCIGPTDIAGGAVNASKIGKNAVVTNKIKGGAVTTPKIKGGAITTSKIRGGAITTSKIRGGAVTEAKLSSEVQVKLNQVGVEGATGPQGITGDTGPQGIPGANGLNGADGAKGDKGDKGDSGADGLAGGINPPDLTTELCELHLKLNRFFTQSGIAVLVNSVPNLSRPIVCFSTLAIAYINNDGIEGYSKDNDTLIAGLFDTNEDGLVSIGDAVILDHYPVDFEGGMIAGDFQRKKFTVGYVKTSLAFEVHITIYNSDLSSPIIPDLVWTNQSSATFSQERLAQAGLGDFEIQDINIDESNIYQDNISVAVDFFGEPSPAVSFTTNLSPSDDSFLDVDIFVQ